MKTQVLFLLTIITILSLSSGKTTKQYFCGRRLADTLALFCQYGGEAKRSGNKLGNLASAENELASYENSLGYGMKSTEENDLGYFTGRGWPMRLQGLRGKRQGGIISECCDQPCELSELLTYC